MPPQGTYEVAYAPDYDPRPGAWRLLELDEALLALVEAGEPVYIKGAADEHAMLCSDEKTYSVKELENTNLVMFGGMDAGDPGKVALWGSTTSVMCVAETAPKWTSVRALLQRDVGDIDLGEDRRDPTTLEFDAPVSRQQLEAFLTDEAFKVDGCWQLPTPAFALQAANGVLSAITAEGLADESFDVDTVMAAVARAFASPGRDAPVLGKTALEALDELPREVVQWTLGQLCAEASDAPDAEAAAPAPDAAAGAASTPRADAGAAAGPRLFRLDPRKVLRHRALEVLAQPSQAEGPVALAALVHKVAGCANVEDCDEPAVVAALLGRAYVDDDTNVCVLDPQQLPDSALGRLEMLFRKRKEWTDAELEPILRPVLGGADLLAFLSKNARAAYHGPRDNERRVFQSRAPGVFRRSN